MSAEITALVKLREVIFMYNESAKQSEATFLRLWRIAFRAFIQMGLNAFWEPLTISLKVNPNMTADIPDNCIQWVKIGQINEIGELMGLRINEDLSTLKDTDPNRLVQLTPEVQGELLGDNWYGVNGQLNGDPLFGLGSRLVQFGECKVDWGNRVILLDPNYRYAHVMLEGLFSPEQNMDYEIPIQFQEAMISWLSWQDIINVPSTSHVGNNQIKMRAHAYKGQLDLAKKMFKPFRLQEASQYFVEGETLAIKS